MTPSELKRHVEQTESHYFTRGTMRFFGDTMANYGVRSAILFVSYDAEGKYVPGGLEIEVWELYRKRPVRHGLSSSAYFDKETFRCCYPIRVTVHDA